ncbi:hypothetical protein BDA99DRAFT_516188, partial [Phascolomyces articulosus]
SDEYMKKCKFIRNNFILIEYLFMLFTIHFDYFSFLWFKFWRGLIEFIVTNDM